MTKSKLYKTVKIVFIAVLILTISGIAILFRLSGYGKCQLGEIYFTKDGTNGFCSKICGEVYAPKVIESPLTFLHEELYIQGIDTETIFGHFNLKMRMLV